MISSIISHGFMDIFAMNSKTNILLLYLVNIFSYYYFLNFNRETGMMVFYLTSCYHFGKDFQIITQDSHGVTNWAGPYILGITLDCSDGIKQWLSILKITGLSNEGCTMFINTVYIIRLISFLGIILAKKDKLIIFSVMALVLNSYMTLYQSTMLYMSTVHVPLALCQFYRTYGLKPLKLWFSGTLLIYSIKWEPILDENLIFCMVSITMSHMILISLWQH